MNSAAIAPDAGVSVGLPSVGDVVRVRDVGASDVLAIHQLRQWAVRETTALWEFDPEDLNQTAQWIQSHQRFGTVIVAETSEGQFAGFAALGQWRGNAGYLHTAEDSIYVHPDFQRRGVGRVLLAQLQVRATSLGFHVVVAAIESTNQASIRLHENMGFEMVGVAREVGWKFNRWLDLATLQWVVR